MLRACVLSVAVKITDLQEEALQAAFKLEREKSRCAKLEVRNYRHNLVSYYTTG